LQAKKQAEMSQFYSCSKGTQNLTFATDVFVNRGTKLDGITRRIFIALHFGRKPRLALSHIVTLGTKRCGVLSQMT